MFLVPDGVEYVHWKSSSLHCQNSTCVLGRIPGLIQVEEVVEFLQIKEILQPVKATLGNIAEAIQLLVGLILTLLQQNNLHVEIKAFLNRKYSRCPIWHFS